MSTGTKQRAFPTPIAPPPIPGLRIRHFTGPTDYPGMNDAANDSRMADGDDFITQVEGFASFYDHLERCDTSQDILIAEVDGRIVGYGRTAWQDEADGDRVHDLVGFLCKDWRRKGIGRTMIAALEARAIMVSAALPPAPKVWLQVFGGVADGGLDALVRPFGFEAIRHAFQMIRPSLDDQPDAPMPEGLDVREVREEHVRQIWEASNEAFRDHFGYREPTEGDYAAFLEDPLSRDRSLWRVAWDGDQVAGQVRGFINDDANTALGTKRGWVENISVGRTWRHRGLARALINETFKVLRERGMTEGTLGVDAQNPTGALRVYESMGFAPVSRSTTYRKPIG